MKSRRAKLEEQKMLAFGRGFFVRCAGPRLAARPLNPRQGVPPAPHAHKPLPATCRGLAEGQGCRGRAPRHPAGRLGSLRSRQGAVLAPAGLRAAPTLDPPSTRKTRHRPAQGLGGALSEGWGSRLAQRPRSGLALTPRNDPNAQGWWLGCSSPAACHVANAPGGRRRRSCL